MTDFRIVWVSGPHKGTVHDLVIAKNCIVKHLKPGETGLGDKAYIGSKFFFAPFKPEESEAQRKYNIIHHKHRQNIERINRRIKCWHILKAVYRHDLKYHHFIFYTICYIVNISLMEVPL